MPAAQAAQPVLPAPHAAFAAAPQTSTSLRVMETKASLVGRADPDSKPGECLPLYQSPIHAGFPSPAEDYTERSLDLHEHLVRDNRRGRCAASGHHPGPPPNGASRRRRGADNGRVPLAKTWREVRGADTMGVKDTAEKALAADSVPHETRL